MRWHVRWDKHWELMGDFIGVLGFSIMGLEQKKWIFLGS